MTPATSYKTADLYDKYGRDLAICKPLFIDYGGNKSFNGQIRTLKCFEDNSKVREMLGEPGNGNVLVVDAGGSLRCAMLGDLLAQMAVDNGWSGVLMNGCIRDSDEIGEMPLGVKALATHPAKSEKRGIGDVDVPVTFACTEFKPGDYLYADGDGIVVSDKPLTL